MNPNYAINVCKASGNVRQKRFYAGEIVRYTRTMKLRLKEIRTQKGWTQKHIADLAGMSVSYYADIERGDKQINANRLNSLALAFDVPATLLIDEETGADDVQIFFDIQKLNQQQKSAVLDLVRNLSAASE